MPPFVPPVFFFLFPSSQVFLKLFQEGVCLKDAPPPSLPPSSPILLGLITYERGHINVAAANTVSSVRRGPSHANVVHFVSLSTSSALAHQILPQGHSYQTWCVSARACVEINLGLMKRLHSPQKSTYFHNLVLKFV